METYRGMSVRRYIERIRALFDYYTGQDLIIEQIDASPFTPEIRKRVASSDLPVVLFTDSYILKMAKNPGIFVILKDYFFRLFYQFPEGTKPAARAKSLARSFDRLMSASGHELLVTRFVNPRDPDNFSFASVDLFGYRPTGRQFKDELLDNPAVCSSNLVKKAYIEEELERHTGRHLYLVDERNFSNKEQLSLSDVPLEIVLHQSSSQLGPKILFGFNECWYKLTGYENDFENAPRNDSGNHLENHLDGYLEPSSTEEADFRQRLDAAIAYLKDHPPR